MSDGRFIKLLAFHTSDDCLRYKKLNLVKSRLMDEKGGVGYFILNHDVWLKISAHPQRHLRSIPMLTKEPNTDETDWADDRGLLMRNENNEIILCTLHGISNGEAIFTWILGVGYSRLNISVRLLKYWLLF